MAVTKVDLTRQATNSGSVSLNSQKITNLLDPTSAQDAATKAYVDAASVGIDWKPSVRVATTAAGTLASSFANGQTVDGVTLATGDRILIKDQSSGAENGIYVVAASGAPTRSSDADTSAEVTAGFAVFVEEGTTNADSGWVLTNNGAITLGSTALTFVQFTGLGQITAGNGLTKTGNQLDVQVDASTIEINADTLRVKDAGITLAKLANLAANSVIANSTGSSATPTAVGMVTAATASTVPIRDSSANIKFNNTVNNLATTATAAGTTTLTVSSAETQQFTGSSTQTVVLPDATTLSVGHSFTITNRSTGAVTVNANGGGLIQTMAAGSQLTVTAVTVGTTAGTWDAAYSVTAAGTVTSVSVTSANGFAGSVATATTTPAITISTTVTGITKGNGTSLSAAVAGTDYLAPSNFVDKETPTGSINGSNTTFTLANTPTSGSEHVYLNGILQESGAGNDYTISGATITYLSAPQTGDRLRVSYRK